MKTFTFTTRTLLALTLVAALVIFLWPKPDPNAPDPKWRETTLLVNLKPLRNIPDVTLVSRKDDQVFVTVTNTGRTTLEYRGSSESCISLFQEVPSDSGWKKDAWSGDGHCDGFYEIGTGESVELEIEFWDDWKAVRMLGKFSEKGTDRSGLVVLAAKTSHTIAEQQYDARGALIRAGFSV